MRELLSEIERAVRARGWSARQASMEAVGTPELIRDMRRGRVPSVERFRALCEALDLEFYVGPKRDRAPVDALRLEQALETADKVLASTGREMGRADKARAVSAIYDLIGEEHGAASAARVVHLIEVVAGSGNAEAQKNDRRREARAAAPASRAREPSRGEGPRCLPRSNTKGAASAPRNPESAAASDELASAGVPRGHGAGQGIGGRPRRAEPLPGLEGPATAGSTSREADRCPCVSNWTLNRPG